MSYYTANTTRSLIFIILVLFLSCSASHDKKEEGRPVRKKPISQDKDTCNGLASIDPDKDFHILTREPVFIQPDDIKDEDRYQKLDKAFYERYLAGSDIVHDWIGGSDHPPDLQTSHFYWGAIQLDNDMCQLILYEHFSYNGNEDKLILLHLDKNGKPIDPKIIAGRVSSPGADIEYSSKIWRDRFHVFRTEKGIIDHKEGKNKYQKDSIVFRYKLTHDHIELTGKDSLRKTYWE